MDLIQLSKEKGFISRDNLIKVNADYKYLWMCELQKWLREVHNIHIVISPILKEEDGDDAEKKSFKLQVSQNYITIDDFFDYLEDEDYETYEEALEAGEQEGLKLIP